MATRETAPAHFDGGALRAEIYQVMFHQEALLQGYRSLLFTIQSLLFGALIACCAVLAAADQSSLPTSSYCVATWTSGTIFYTTFFMMYCVGWVIVIVGLLSLGKFQVALVPRERNVYFCQNLLFLDEIGALRPLWQEYLTLANGRPVGMQSVLRLHNRGWIPPVATALFKTVNFEVVRSEIAKYEYEGGGPSRSFFKRNIMTYYYALWFSVTLALALYGSRLFWC